MCVCVWWWQVGPCVNCKGIVPLNAPNCLMCEAPLQAQNVPQASLRLANKLLCIVCGTANPPNITSCVMCAANLLADSKVTFLSYLCWREVTITVVKSLYICRDVDIGSRTLIIVSVIWWWIRWVFFCSSYFEQLIWVVHMNEWIFIILMGCWAIGLLCECVCVCLPV